MGTPRYTSEGVKVRSGEYNHHCGHCGKFIQNSYGFPSAGVECPHCHTRNRPDWSLDLASERLGILTLMMGRLAQETDRITAWDIYDGLHGLIEEVRTLEKRDRESFSAAGFRQLEPAREFPSPMAFPGAMP